MDLYLNHFLVVGSYEELHPNRIVYAVSAGPVSYTHLRAHETVLDLVCRLLLEKKKNNIHTIIISLFIQLDAAHNQDYVHNEVL